MNGISLLRSEIPNELFEQYQLRQHVTRRSDGALDEVRFLWKTRSPVLPIWSEGEFRLIRWGNRNRSNRLPFGPYIPIEAIKSGSWNDSPKVEVIANYGYENHVWYHLVGGIQGILIYSRDGDPHLYPLTQPASHYYEVMTRSQRMPVFTGQGI